MMDRQYFIVRMSQYEGKANINSNLGKRKWPNSCYHCHRIVLYWLWYSFWEGFAGWA